MKDGRRFLAKLIGRDPATDLAVLRLQDAQSIKAIPMGDSDKLEVGDFVLAIGNPFGLGQTVTSGLVSALGRTGLAKQGYEDFIQTDAPINPGNSGGALVNLRGQLMSDETPIRSAAALRNKLGLTPVGERLQLPVKRKGLSQKIVVEMAATDEIAQTGSVNRPPSFAPEPARLVI